jgi:hypothetical protein
MNVGVRTAIESSHLIVQKALNSIVQENEKEMSDPLRNAQDVSPSR